MIEVILGITISICFVLIFIFFILLHIDESLKEIVKMQKGEKNEHTDYGDA